MRNESHDIDTTIAITLPAATKTVARITTNSKNPAYMVDSPQTFPAGGVAVEEPQDLPAEARQGLWQLLTSLLHDVISASIRVPVSLLVLVATCLMRWNYTRRKRWALIKDQKYMVGFCSIASDEKSNYNHKSSNLTDNVVVASSSKHNSPRGATIRSIHLSEIRDKQQTKLVMANERTQRQIDSQQHIRKQILHTNLNHSAANDAHRRRMNIILQEALLLQPHYDTVEQQYRQEVHYDELEEEIDRRRLIQEQDMEYQQSLQNDQHRARQLASMNDREVRRSKALGEARQRLTVAGVIPHSNCKGFDITVRLLLPSGQKIDGSFQMKHSMGLVYDLALLALDMSKILWNPADNDDDGLGTSRNQHSNDGAEDIDTTFLRDALPANNNSYNEIQTEWRHLFYPFAIASTYPKQTYDNLSSTLENCCGFHNHGGSIALVVMVEFT